LRNRPAPGRISAGVTRIAPSVDSGSLSSPTGVGVIQDAKVDVASDTRLTAAVSYMVTDHVSLHLPLGLGFKHDVFGAGILAGVGKVADTRALPITLIAQYRFMEARRPVSPLSGRGPDLRAVLQGARQRHADRAHQSRRAAHRRVFQSKLAPTVQVGGVLNLNAKWFVEGSYAKTFLKTRGTLSTGQTIDVGLDPDCFTLHLGYRF
jgi:outer membrane protein